jgi:hypothetical protein
MLVVSVDISDFSEALPGPKIYTFTCRIPFVLGIADSLDHRISIDIPFVDTTDNEHFGAAYVNIRIFNAPLPDEKFWPTNMPRAVEHFYDGDIGPAPSEGTFLYEQWITLETPGGLLEAENPSDPGYAFHRCLRILNLFLQAFALARADDSVRPISARELRPIVVIGAIGRDSQWHYISQMLMHPDAKERVTGTWTAKMHLVALDVAMAGLLRREPYIPTRQWRARAERRRYEGDAADSVISFQVAAETLLYETWRLLMVDEGQTTEYINRVTEKDLPFKSLLIRELHGKLGGNWDVTHTSSPVGIYWENLYLLRSKILHAGYYPHDGDAEEAEKAFLALERFVEERLRQKQKAFPRTLLAKVGREELSRRGWLSPWMRRFIEKIDAEADEFYLPRDIASRTSQ